MCDFEVIGVPSKIFGVPKMIGVVLGLGFFVYYETLKRELNKSLIYECLCDERLKGKGEIYTPRIHCVDRGTGTPEDRDEVNKREVVCY